MTVPSGLSAGDVFVVKVGKKWVDVKVPQGLVEGDSFTLVVDHKKPIHDNPATTMPMFIPFCLPFGF